VATTFGILAGWLRMRTESVVAPVLLHVTMNVVAVV
jgi:membrane protease YdiL (CAAX protease family)